MSNTLFYTIIGAIFGAIGGVCLSIGKWELIIIYIIGGAIIGFCYGNLRNKDEKKSQKKALDLEESHKQNKKNAAELKQNAIKIINVYTNDNSSYVPLISTTYTTYAQMDAIINELTKIAGKQGKIECIVDELSKKGGVPL